MDKNFGKCNMIYCRFNKDGNCTDKEHREECIYVCVKVLNSDYEEFCEWKASTKR